MVNKLVNLRIGSKLLREIDSVVRNETYENRTEFIRETLREAVERRKKERIIRGLEKGLGVAKKLGVKEPTSGEFEKIREGVGRKTMKRHGLN